MVYLKKRLTLILSLLLLVFGLSTPAFAVEGPTEYNKVINTYLNALDIYDQGGGYEAARDSLPEDYYSVGMTEGFGSPLSDYLYSLKDITGDGTPELFLYYDLGIDNTGAFDIVFTIVNGQPKSILAFKGWAGNCYLLKDNNLLSWDKMMEEELYYSVDSEGNAKEIGAEAHDFQAISYSPITGRDMFTSSTTPAPSEPSTPSTPSTPSNPSTPSGQKEVYRLYNPQSTEHLYTTDPTERDTLARNGWNNEGVGWNAPSAGKPVYRLYSPITGGHLYTTDQNEINTITNQGWQLDNSGQPLFYSDGSNPVYRLYNPHIMMHLLTTNVDEYNQLAGQGWNQEGTAFNCL